MALFIKFGIELFDLVTEFTLFVELFFITGIGGDKINSSLSFN
jgi:hypothetical protein